MTISINVPLRVKHFNSQITQKEGKIRFNKTLGSDKDNPFFYTSDLYEEVVNQNGWVDAKEGDVCLYQLNAIGNKIIVAEAQSFLHLLFYMAYEHQQKIQQAKLEAKIRAREAKELAKAKNKKSVQLSLLDFSLEQEELEKQVENNTPTIGFELEEEDGVTKIKGTNSVLSKFL